MGGGGTKREGGQTRLLVLHPISFVHARRPDREPINTYVKQCSPARTRIVRQLPYTKP